MKKKLFVLPLILLPMLVVGCNSQTFTSRVEYPGIPTYPDKPDNPDVPEEPNMVVYFYLDYSHSDEPFYEMDWYSMVELGSCPAGAVLTDADAPDPVLYPKFLGYSEYPSAMDEEKLWNFETDYKQSNVLSLYGIWVSK